MAWISSETAPATGNIGDEWKKPSTGERKTYNGTTWVITPGWTADKLLKGAGAGVAPTEIDVPSSDFFDKYRMFVPWVSLDGFTVGGDVGYSIIAGVGHLYMETAALTDNDAYVYATKSFARLFHQGIVTVEFAFLSLNQNWSVNVWLRLATALEDPPVATSTHYGWVIVETDLFASNATGGAQTITDTGVNIDTIDLQIPLKMVISGTNNCKFYVNRVLKVTHTTNLPNLSNTYLNFHTRTLQNAGKSIKLGRTLIEMAYS